MNNTPTQGSSHPVHVICGTARIGSHDITLRSGDVLVHTLVDAYMAVYKGRDQSIAQRMRWWQAKIGHLKLSEVDEDHIYFALQELSQQSARYYCGKDADGNPIFKSKKRPHSPATLNRYAATAGALFTWCIRQRIAPKGWVHPCRGIERKPKNNEIIRHLSSDECERLLAACKASKWPKMYLLVLLGLTTGSRRGEFLRLRWGDIDFVRKQAYVHISKNTDKKVLPLTDAVRLLVAWRGEFGSIPTMVREAVKRVMDGFGKKESELKEVLLEIAGSGQDINRQRVGKALSRYEGRVVNGMKFQKVKSTGNAEKWKVFSFDEPNCTTNPGSISDSSDSSDEFGAIEIETY